MAVAMLDLVAEHRAIRDELRAAIDAVVDSGGFVFGPQLEAFEKEMAEYCGVGHAVGLSSGTDALLAALMALEVGSGDEVIVPAFTFFATASSVWRLGARPVFVDIDPITFNIAPDPIEAAVTEKTKAIIPVHLFGQCADMSAICAVAERHGLPVIEDAAQGLGARDRGRPAGSIGAVGCLSFYPSKTLGALGDAGMCLTGDADLAEKIRRLRHHGQTDPYRHAYVGGNFRMDAIQAAALRVKLSHLDEYLARRGELASRYHELLADLPVQTPGVAEHQHHAFNYYTIRAPRRDELRQYLTDHEIGVSVFYPLPLHLQPCFAALGGKAGDYPVAEEAAEEVLSLPIYPALDDARQNEVAEAIRSFYHQ